jgi:hypothetical protein
MLLILFVRQKKLLNELNVKPENVKNFKLHFEPRKKKRNAKQGPRR